MLDVKKWPKHLINVVRFLKIVLGDAFTPSSPSIDS